MASKNKCINTKQIALKIANTTSSTINISILQNSGRDTFVNATTLYKWNITDQIFGGVTEVTLQAKTSPDGQYVVYSAPINVQSIDGVLDALNSLKIGTFIREDESGDIYIRTYNDDFIYNEMDIISGATLPDGLISGYWRVLAIPSTSLGQMDTSIDDAVFWCVYGPGEFPYFKWVLHDSNNILPDVDIAPTYSEPPLVPGEHYFAGGKISMADTDFTQYDTFKFYISKDGTTYQQYSSSPLVWDVNSGQPEVPTNGFGVVAQFEDPLFVEGHAALPIHDAPLMATNDWDDGTKFSLIPILCQVVNTDFERTVTFTNSESFEKALPSDPIIGFYSSQDFSPTDALYYGFNLNIRDIALDQIYGFASLLTALYPDMQPARPYVGVQTKNFNAIPAFGAGSVYPDMYINESFDERVVANNWIAYAVFKEAISGIATNVRFILHDSNEVEPDIIAAATSFSPSKIVSFTSFYHAFDIEDVAIRDTLICELSFNGGADYYELGQFGYNSSRGYSPGQRQGIATFDGDEATQEVEYTPFYINNGENSWAVSSVSQFGSNIYDAVIQAVKFTDQSTMDGGTPLPTLEIINNGSSAFLQRTIPSSITYDNTGVTGDNIIFLADSISFVFEPFTDDFYNIYELLCAAEGLSGVWYPAYESGAIKPSGILFNAVRLNAYVNMENDSLTEVDDAAIFIIASQYNSYPFFKLVLTDSGNPGNTHEITDFDTIPSGGVAGCKVITARIIQNDLDFTQYDGMDCYYSMDGVTWILASNCAIEWDGTFSQPDLISTSFDLICQTGNPIQDNPDTGDITLQIQNNPSSGSIANGIPGGWEAGAFNNVVQEIKIKAYNGGVFDSEVTPSDTAALDDEYKYPGVVGVYYQSADFASGLDLYLCILYGIIRNDGEGFTIVMNPILQNYYTTLGTDNICMAIPIKNFAV